MTQQGDIFLFQTNDDGDINVENGLIEFSGGLDTAVYLSLFGGNEDDDGRDNNVFNWWGNYSEIDTANQYHSETQNLINGLPAIPANLRRIESAVIRDTKWLIEKNIASSVSTIVSIPALHQIKIIVNIEARGLETSFEFVENWKVNV